MDNMNLTKLPSGAWKLINDWSFTLLNGTRICIPEGFIFESDEDNLIPKAIHAYCYQYGYLWQVHKVADPMHMNCSYTKYGYMYPRYIYDELMRILVAEYSGSKLKGWLHWLEARLLGRNEWNKYRLIKQVELFPGE